jgi:membrane fusion protein (multidrug efflux system)
MKKFAGLLLVALLAACGEGDKKPGAGPAAGGPGAAPPPPEVEVLTIAPGSATLTQDLPGRLMAVRSAQIRARVEGVLEKRLFNEGSDIAAGAPLFRIDTRTYEANRAAAEADLAAAAAAFNRLKPLLDIKAVSQQEYDQASARHKQAEAALARARLDLENASHRRRSPAASAAPWSPRARWSASGEATHLATIEQLDPIYASNFTQSIPTCCACSRPSRPASRRRPRAAKVELLLEDGSIYPNRARCASPTSPSIPTPARCCCAPSSPTRVASCCPAPSPASASRRPKWSRAPRSPARGAVSRWASP